MGQEYKSPWGHGRVSGPATEVWVTGSPGADGKASPHGMAFNVPRDHGQWLGRSMAGLGLAWGCHF